jgi:hypothetical protein
MRQNRNLATLTLAISFVLAAFSSFSSSLSLFLSLPLSFSSSLLFLFLLLSFSPFLQIASWSLRSVVCQHAMPASVGHAIHQITDYQHSLCKTLVTISISRLTWGEKTMQTCAPFVCVLLYGPRLTNVAIRLFNASCY